MAQANPNPTLITPALWSYWLGFRKVEPSAVLSGIYAHKRGYHSSRSENRRKWPDDYSIRLPADKVGPAGVGRAIDLSMPLKAMVRQTKRLDRAAKAMDPRLYPQAGPVLREFIGTRDGVHVYCYDLDEAREYHDRDATHLWHLHESVHGRHVASRPALSGLLSVQRGQGLTDWRRQNDKGEEDMDKAETLALLRSEEGREAIADAVVIGLSVAMKKAAERGDATGRNLGNWIADVTVNPLANRLTVMEAADQSRDTAHTTMWQAQSDALAGVTDALDQLAALIRSGSGNPDTAIIVGRIETLSEDLAAVWTRVAAALQRP